MLSRLDPQAKRLLRRIPIAAAVAFLLWFAAGSEAYERTLAAVTETTLRAFERPPVTFLTWTEGKVVIRRSDFSSRSEFPVFDLASVAGNAVLLFALYLSTPGAGTREGMARGLIAFLLLFASHVLHFALAIQTIYATQLGSWSVYNYARWQREIVATGRYFFDIALKYALPFVIWGLVILLPEIRRREAAAEAAQAEKAQPKTWRERRKLRRRR